MLLPRPVPEPCHDALQSEMTLDTSVLLEKPSDSSILPLPQQDSPDAPKPEFTIENQEPLGGGSPVPVPSLIEGDAAQPSVSDVIANTMQKRPAMMLGLPMVPDTGVSLTAKPITVYRGAAGNMGTVRLTFCLCECVYVYSAFVAFSAHPFLVLPCILPC
jgi:hypothetical protein